MRRPSAKPTSPTASAKREKALAQPERLAGLWPARQGVINELKVAVKRLCDTGERMVKAYIEQGREAGNAIMKADDGFDAAAEKVTKELESLAGELATLGERSDAAQQQTRVWMLRSSLGVGALALVFVVLSYLLLLRVLMKLLGGEPAYAGKMAAQIAAGGLTQGLQVRPNDQSSLLASLGDMQQSLRATVASIRDSSHAVLSAAESLNAQAGVVVDRLQTESDTATSMSASVEEIAASITQVADEVRKLTERTANSTREISQMIEAIGSRSAEAVPGMEQRRTAVGQSVTQAEKAYAAMSLVRENLGSVVGEVSEITLAVEERRAASTTIAQNVEQVAQMVEQNRHAVAAIAADVRRLEQLSRNLDNVTSRFRV